MFKVMIKPVSLLLVFSFLFLDFSVQTAQAQMVDTNTVIAAQQDEANRSRVAAFMGREEVQQAMTQYGVDPAEAQKRVDSLSNAEVADIANSMDQLPAGAGGIGTIVGAAVLIFLVLLLTDILGFTNVYPFVNHPK